MKVTEIHIVIETLDKITLGMLQRVQDLKNKRTSGDHPNYRIVGIGQNTEKSLGNLGTLALTQTPVENCQLTME